MSRGLLEPTKRKSLPLRPERCRLPSPSRTKNGSNRCCWNGWRRRGKRTTGEGGGPARKNEPPRLSPFVRRPPPRSGEMPLQHGFRIDVGLLQVNAPIFQLFERDRQAGHRATHEGTRPHDAKIAVKVFDLGLTRHGGRTIGSVQQACLHATGLLGPRIESMSVPVPTHNIVARASACNPPAWDCWSESKCAGLRKHYAPNRLP